MAPPPEIARTLAAPAAVYVVLGDEAVLVREAVDAVRSAVVSGPMAAFNHAVFTAGEESALGFTDACRQVPVMAARRLVELRQVQDASVALLEALLNYVPSPIDSTTLLLSGVKMPAAVGGTDRGVRVVNAVKKSGVVCKLDAKTADPLALARSRCAPWGATIDVQAVHKLREFGGDDLDALVGNVELCAGYVGEGGAITADVVAKVCATTAVADVWKLTDAIVARSPDFALAELHHLLEEGEASHRLLASVAWQLRQVLLVQDAMHRNIPDRDAGVRMPPDKLRAVRAACERKPVSPSAWLEELALANRRMNSSRAGDRRVLESFVLRLVVG